MTRFSGVWPALITPLTPDDQINMAATRRLVEHLLRTGIGGLYVGGSTGEGVLLPVAARQRLAEVVIEQVNRRVPVMVHVGAAATADAVALAAHAAAAGADAVASVPPFYFQVGFRGIKEHYQMIADASSLPLYLYYIPGATGVSLSAAQMAELCQIQNVRGFKYTAYDLYLLEQIMALTGGQMNIFSGPDELFLPFLALGVDGAIGTSYNFLASHYVRLYRAFQQGDLAAARRLQSQANRIIDIFGSYGGLPAVKEMMRFIGLDCGDCRRPLRKLDEGEITALRAALQEARFWELADIAA